MLEPQNRRLLLESLRPPEGYTLDAAIGTTYSLDLVALLTAPLSFALFDWQNEDGRLHADPLALVEAVRRHADRIALFCQAGEIQVPTGDRRLLSYLEDSVVEVMPKKKGFVFHPKLWVLRFVAPDQPVAYRLVCLSRNLTFDRSWDTTVVLDGVLTDRARAFKPNHGLANLVKALPSLALRSVSGRIQAQVQKFQEELRVVRFEVPAPFEKVDFWPLGIPGAQHPFDWRVDRLLVISPFLSDGALQKMTDEGKDHVLLTRPDALASLQKKTRERFKRTCVLNDAAEEEPDPEASVEQEQDAGLRGLHAKAYVIDYGWEAGIMTGSANATDAAFHGNVEFLVELRGKKSKCGVAAVLEDAEGRATLNALMQDVTPPDKPDKGDAAEKRLDKAIADARLALIDAKPKLNLDAGEDGLFEATLQTETPLRLPKKTELRSWPISLRKEMARPVAQDTKNVTLGRLSFEALTSFVSFELQVTESGGRTRTSSFVLNLPVEGMPEGRRERMLQSLLKDRSAVLRLLLLLLADDPEEGMAALIQGQREGGGGSVLAGWGQQQLLESLLRCLDRAPERLEEVASLVDELSAKPATAELLPEGFLDIWAPIWQARQEMKREQGTEAA